MGRYADAKPPRPWAVTAQVQGARLRVHWLQRPPAAPTPEAGPRGWRPPERSAHAATQAVASTDERGRPHGGASTRGHLHSTQGTPAAPGTRGATLVALRPAAGAPACVRARGRGARAAAGGGAGQE